MIGEMQALLECGWMYLELVRTQGTAAYNAAVDAAFAASKNAPGAQWSYRARSLSMLRWAQSGFPRIEMGHKRAAAFAATSATIDAVGEIRGPWAAYVVAVPPGLWDGSPHFSLVADLGVPETGRGEPWPAGAHFITTFRSPHRSKAEMIVGGLSGLLLDTRVDGRNGLSALDNLATGQEGLSEDVPVPPEMQCLHRIIIGATLDVMQYRPSSGGRWNASPKVDARTGKPSPRTFVLRGPVTVDVRDAVAEWAEGRRSSSPKVRTLVRGHWKRQVCGQRGEGRRFIFVQPYWRGPDDAPGVLRAHRIGTYDRPEAS